LGASLITAPTVEPVTLDQAKLHARVDIDTDDDLIEALIEAARHWVEGQTHRALCTQTWDFTFDEFPCRELRLPLAPVSSVASVTYVDSSGVEQSLTGSPAEYQQVVNNDHPYIVPLYNETWPEARCQPNAVTVRAVCGYGAAAAVPAPLVQAILLLVGHWYESREAAGPSATELPFAVEALISPYRRPTFGR
jgi:uncharacterized phiE125 gp8 family phage protein